MKQILTILIMGLFFASCQQQSTSPTFTYQCTVYQISTINGDTSVYWVGEYPNVSVPPQVMQDSINNTLNGGNHPFSFVKCQ